VELCAPARFAGGDPIGEGYGGTRITIDAEFQPTRGHNTGTVNMARADDVNSADTQFSIMLVPNHFLDNRYTVWGQVCEGRRSLPQPYDDQNAGTFAVAVCLTLISARPCHRPVVTKVLSGMEHVHNIKKGNGSDGRPSDPIDSIIKMRIPADVAQTCEDLYDECPCGYHCSVIFVFISLLQYLM